MTGRGHTRRFKSLSIRPRAVPASSGFSEGVQNSKRPVQVGGSTGVETQRHGPCRFYGSSHGWLKKSLPLWACASVQRQQVTFQVCRGFLRLGVADLESHLLGLVRDNVVVYP